MVVKTFDQILKQKRKEFDKKAQKLSKETLIHRVGSDRPNGSKIKSLRIAYSQILFDKYTDSKQSERDYDRSDGRLKSLKKRSAKKSVKKRPKSSKKTSKKKSKRR